MRDQVFQCRLPGAILTFVNACDTIFGQIGGICYTLVQHADGTFVGIAGYPNGKLARPGETITFYAVGLGATNPPVPTGHAAPSAPLATIDGRALPLIVSYVLSLPPASPSSPIVWAPAKRWIFPSYIGLVPGYVGLYQVNVTLPAELAQAQASTTSDPCGLTVRIAIGAGEFGPADGVTRRCLRQTVARGADAGDSRNGSATAHSRFAGGQTGKVTLLERRNLANSRERQRGFALVQMAVSSAMVPCACRRATGRGQHTGRAFTVRVKNHYPRYELQFEGVALSDPALQSPVLAYPRDREAHHALLRRI
ncbi:MAG: hypothetical protein DMG57_05490 [Acidobacteria bacterium]|nr:MAG: hypothetical protein DMG57_05490 [Acidobacteriota bacterium]